MDIPSKPVKKKERKPRKSRKTVDLDGFVIALAGVHGVGKTTIYELLTRRFERFHNINFYPERIQAKPYVVFGSKDKIDAFRSQVYYHHQMSGRNILIKQHVVDRHENIAITDRSPISILVYSRALELSEIDSRLVEDSYKNVEWQDEYLIYFEADPETILDRIYHRGRLDQERQKWNEDDRAYLIKVIQEYENTFRELQLFKKGRLFRVWTENKTPIEIESEVFAIIEKITQFQIKKQEEIPSNQITLNGWIQAK